jgi:protein-L-isoaspartate(D-aspartate) O-methyltransferase
VHLSAVEDGTVRIQADQQAVESGLCTPAIPIRTPALVEGDSLAYFAYRPAEGQPGRYQLGAYAHGPRGEDLAARIVDQIIVWDQDRDADPEILAYPTGFAADHAPGKRIGKPDITLVLRYR